MSLIKVEVLTSAALEVRRGLFFHGPTWDGDVPSKVGRDQLVRLGLAERYEGYQWLTRDGVEGAINDGLAQAKDEYWRARAARERR